MADNLPEGSLQNPDLEDFLTRLQEAAANEYGPAFRALQNDSTIVQISGSLAGTPDPEGRPNVRARSPELQDYTVKWPEPDSNFIGTITDEVEIPRGCRLCGAGDDVHPASLVMCAGCGAPHRPVHKKCLRRYPGHSLLPSGSRARRGACEEVPFKEYVYLTWLLDSNHLQAQTTSLHLDDLRTTWFGVPHDQRDSPPKLFIWPRVQNLLANASDQPHYQYPSLISFVGDTGSGKSTLIKALVRMLAPQNRARYQVPVPGTGQDQFTSTSSDVHLYADPWTISTEVPILFADCEGMVGTSTPVSHRVTSAEFRNQRSHVSRRAARDMEALVKEHRKKASSDIYLTWARTSQPSVPAPRDQDDGFPDYSSSVLERRDSDDFSDFSDAASHTSASETEPLFNVQADSRDLITKNLYPRLLYAFSDVVCFVTANTRESQNILWRLFDWSKDGLERTFNQRVRPGLIIIVNKNSSDYDDMLPNVDSTTDRFLQSVERSSKFQEYRQKWISRQRRINTAADLIQCYYDDFRVISLPLHSDMPSTASRVSRQIKRLYHEIRTLSDNIHSRRKARDLVMDVATFNSYFTRSVEILARDHTSSLDFHPLAEEDSPLPTRFSEHMALVLGKMAKSAECNAGGELAMVKKVIPFLACAILCQIARQREQGGKMPVPSCTQKIPKTGKANKRNNQPDTQTLQEQLVDEACRGLERFRNKFWRCEAVSNSSRCQNYWESHGTYHQFEHAQEEEQTGAGNGGGTRPGGVGANKSRPPQVNLVVGQHECSYGSYVGVFRDSLWSSIYLFSQGGQDVRGTLVSYARSLGINRLESQRTCLSCLSNCPTNVLPCDHRRQRYVNSRRQHAVCEDCIRWHTAPPQSAGCVIAVESCPLGCQFREPPWMIRVKPIEAQSRILVLDGGGIRGVVELVILSRLMDEIKFDIPIQQLFDLVIGTSGIIALGVFEMGWTPAQATVEFRRLAQQAFTKKLRLRIPVVKYVAEYFCTFRYQSTGVENALKTAFGSHQYLFGQSPEAGSPGRGDDVKVGVVSCIEGRDQPCLIANYNRNPMQGSKNGRHLCLACYPALEKLKIRVTADYLQREENQRNDFKIWQAARATSAAQTYFEPYKHKPTSKVYVDGAIVRNNPVRVALEEERRIWGAELRPDIVVSIGSGICVEESGEIRQNKRSVGTWKKVLPARVRKMVDTGIDMVASTLDCQREWDEAVRVNPQLSGKCHRLDVGIFDKKLPALDDVDKMEELEELSLAYLAKNSDTGQRYFNKGYNSAYAHLRIVARRLLAALFYYSDAASLNENNQHPKRLTGLIHCRLPPSQGARQLMAAAKFRVRECRTTRSRHGLDEPVIREIYFMRKFDPVTLSAHVLFDILAGSWTRTIEVSFPSSQDSGWAAISGF
ncbi:hypothetical protein V8F33_010301 [Rhypophila sp. PSN 637]